MVYVFLVLVAALFAFGLFRVTAPKKAAGPRPAQRLAPMDNKNRIDYNIYIMGKKEKVFYLTGAAVFCFILAYLFYRSIFFSLLVMPLALFYPRVKTREIIKKRKQELSLQLKEALYALSSSLMVGRSVESAFQEALHDLVLLYPDPQSYIIQEFTYITRRLAMNETIEKVLLDFAARAHLVDLDNFVDVFVLSKRTGGNLVEIIRNTSTIIGDKLQIKQEIETLLAQRKLEQKILNVVPLLLIFLLTQTTGDYMEPVFTTLGGRMIMTVVVFLLAFAYYLSEKIMTIEV